MLISVIYTGCLIDLTKNSIKDDIPTAAITQTAGARTKSSLTMTPMNVIPELYFIYTCEVDSKNQIDSCEKFGFSWFFETIVETNWGEEDQVVEIKEEGGPCCGLMLRD